MAALEVAATEMAVGLHGTDDGLDGRSAFNSRLMTPNTPALLAGDEDAAGILCMAALSHASTVCRPRGEHSAAHSFDSQS